MTKYAGRHLALLIGDGGSPENFAVVGQVTSLGEAGSSRDLIDASAYGDDWKDYVIGQQDGAEVEVTVAYDPADTQHDAIQSAYDTAAKRNFQLRHTPAGFQVQFPAYVTELSRGAERDGVLQLSATLKIVAPGITDLS